MNRAAVVGSAPDHAGYRRTAAADPGMSMRVSIILRQQNDGIAGDLLAGRYDPATSSAPGAADNAVLEVEAFAQNQGLKVEKADAPSRMVVVAGSAEQMEQAFGVQLAWYSSSDGSRHISYEGNLTIPSQIAPYVLAVLGLDTRPVARPR